MKVKPVLMDLWVSLTVLQVSRNGCKTKLNNSNSFVSIRCHRSFNSKNFSVLEDDGALIFHSV